MNNPSSIIENLINGNLTEAQYDAKYVSAGNLIHAAEGIGYNYNESLLMACYLKGVISFQEYCDSLNNKN
jgi:hypothetical protein